jgi:short-subunit dehydrogenase
MNNTHRSLTYWITGAGSGIGLSLTELLVKHGHRVLISGRSETTLHALAKRLGSQVIPLPCDVSDDKQMLNLFDSVAHLVNHLDCAILCAGTCEYIDYPDLDINTIRQVTAVNYFGTVNSCIAAMPLLENARQLSPKLRAHLIGVSSMSCYIGFPRAEAYGASKAAMSYFLNSLRCDVGSTVDITIAYPGFVDTPLTRKNDFPMPFIISADQAAKSILKKCKKRPKSIGFPWRLHVLLALMRMFSGIWYSYLVPNINRNKGKDE